MIEQTVNTKQKGPGGIIGFSTTPGTVQRLVTTSHVIATISSKFKKDTGFDESKSAPKDLLTKHIMADKESTFLKRPMLSSGCVAPKHLQDDLLNTEHIGTGQLKDSLPLKFSQMKQSFMTQ